MEDVTKGTKKTLQKKQPKLHFFAGTFDTAAPMHKYRLPSEVVRRINQADQFKIKEHERSTLETVNMGFNIFCFGACVEVVGEKHCTDINKF